MQAKSKKTTEEYARILSSRGNIYEKREIIIHAIEHEQKKFLNTCRERWGDDYYFEIVGEC